MLTTTSSSREPISIAARANIPCFRKNLFSSRLLGKIVCDGCGKAPQQKLGDLMLRSWVFWGGGGSCHESERFTSCFHGTAKNNMLEMSPRWFQKVGLWNGSPQSLQDLSCSQMSPWCRWAHQWSCEPDKSDGSEGRGRLGGPLSN